MQDNELNDLYLQFIEAAERKDCGRICDMIRGHPEFHNFVGDDGDLIDVIDGNCPEFFAAAFAAGLHPDSGQIVLTSFLQSAACDNDAESIKLAVRYGADLERRNERGETALGYAVGWENFEAVRALLEAGADVNAIEYDAEHDYRNTALDCCSAERTDIYELLRNYGAKTYKELRAEQEQREL